MSTALARRQVRTLALNALNTLSGPSVDSPGDWDAQPKDLPNIKLRAIGDRKVSIGRVPPEFTTTVTLDLLLSAAGKTAEDAQDAIESLCGQVENVLLTNQPLLAVVQQFNTVASDVSISAAGSQHIAQSRMQLECETFETFDPLQVNPGALPDLQQVGIHVDATNVADPTGTYPNPPFPQAVTPAPRTAGPDGRDEGHVEINLQS
jgi:hypothetical protein